MDINGVRNRVERLKEELAKRKAAGRSMNAVENLLEQASLNYEDEKYDAADALIERAFRLLDKPEPEAAAPSDKEAQKTLMSVFGISDNDKPTKDTLGFFALFALLFSITSSIVILPIIGIRFHLATALAEGLVMGALSCFVTSALTWAMMRAMGGGGTMQTTMSVYAYSLVPLLAASILVIYVGHSSSFLSFRDLSKPDAKVGAVFIGVLSMGGAAWTLWLQVVGLAAAHEQSRWKSLFAALLMDVAGAIALAASMYMLLVNSA